MTESTAQLLANFAHSPALSLSALAVPVAMVVGYVTVRRRIHPIAHVAFWTLFTVVAAVYAYVVIGHAGCAALKARSAGCMQTQKSLGQALLMYAEDHDATFPPTAVWPEAAKMGNRTCPSADTPFGYGFHDRLGAKAIDRLDAPADTPLLFDADATVRNFAGGKDAVAWRHSSGSNIAFADGHAQWIGPYRQTAPQWENLFTTP